MSNYYAKVELEYEGSPLIPAVTLMVLTGRLIDPADKAQTIKAVEAIQHLPLGLLVLAEVARSEQVRHVARHANPGDPNDAGLEASIGMAAGVFMSEHGGVLGLAEHLKVLERSRIDEALAVASNANDNKRFSILNNEDETGGTKASEAVLDAILHGRDKPEMKMFGINANGEIEGDTSGLPDEVKDLLEALAGKRRAQVSDNETQGG